MSFQKNKCHSNVNTVSCLYLHIDWPRQWDVVIFSLWMKSLRWRKQGSRGRSCIVWLTWRLRQDKMELLAEATATPRQMERETSCTYFENSAQEEITEAVKEDTEWAISQSPGEKPLKCAVVIRLGGRRRRWACASLTGRASRGGWGYDAGSWEANCEDLYIAGV